MYAVERTHQGEKLGYVTLHPQLTDADAITTESRKFAQQVCDSFNRDYPANRYEVVEVDY